MSSIYNGSTSRAILAIRTPEALSTNDFTIAVTFKTPSTIAAQEQTICSIGPSTSWFNGARIGINAAGYLEMSSHNSTVRYIVSTVQAVPDTVYRVLLTKTTGTDSKFYVNNLATVVTASNFNVNGSATALMVGAKHTSTTGSDTIWNSLFAGFVTYVSYWKSVLSNADITYVLTEANYPIGASVQPDEYWTMIADGASALSGGSVATINAVTFDTAALRSSSSVTSINNGNAIPSGGVNIPAILNGFTGTPTSITCMYAGETKSLLVSNIQGTASSVTFNIADRANAEDYPIDGASLLFTFIYGTEVATSSAAITKKATETLVSFSNPVTADATYIAKDLVTLGHTVTDGDFYYVPYGNLVVGTNSGVNASTPGTFQGWFRPISGSTAGKMYLVNVTVIDSSRLNYGGSVNINTLALSSINNVTVGGRTITGFTGSNNVYSINLPALSAGISVPLIGQRTATLTNGSVTENFYVNVATADAQTYVTLTSVVNTIGYIGYYIPGCSINDQVVYDKAITRGVSTNTIGADGRLLTDFSGSQTAYHIRATDGLVTQLVIISPSISVDTLPNIFSFTTTTNAALSTVYESDYITVSGVDAGINIPISITGGEYAYSSNNGLTYSSFTAVTGSVRLGYRVKLRGTASVINNANATVTVDIGTRTASYVITTGADITINSISFTTVTGANLNSLVESGSFGITGADAGIDIYTSISNGTFAYSSNGGSTWSAWLSTGNVRNGYLVKTRVNTSTGYSTNTTCTITIGTISGTFIATTRSAVTLPSIFSLTAVTAAIPLTVYTSNTITVNGVDSNVNIPLSITAGEYSVNNGAWLTSNTNVQLGDTVKVRLAADLEYDTAASLILDIGGRSSVYIVTTRVADVTPTSLIFTSASSVGLNISRDSNAITISGMDVNIDVPYEVTNGTASIHNGTSWSAYSATGMIRNGYQLILRTTTPVLINQTKIVSISISTVTGVWSIDTNNSGIVVDPFTFNAVTNAAINTTFDSSPITLSGMTIGTLTTVNISGGKYRVLYRNTSTQWLTGTSQIPFGCEIIVRLTTTDTYQIQHNAVLTVGGYSAAFSVTTKVPRTTPRSFSFNTIGDAVKAHAYESVTTIIKGFDIGVQATANISNGEYKLDTGSGFGDWISTPGVITSGSIVKLRATAASSPETTKLVTLNVNGVSGTFTLITRKDPLITTSDDIVADFVITPVTNAEPNARIESNAFIVTGVDQYVTLPISVVNGEYSINGGAFTTLPSKVILGNSIKLAGRCKSSYNAVNEVTVSLGAATYSFSLTTRSELTTLNAVSFYSVIDATPSTDIESNIVTISGIDATFPVTLTTGGGLLYRIDRGFGFEAYTASDGIAKLGDHIQVLITSSALNETLRIGTLTLNGTNSQFRVTTSAAPTLTVFSSIARTVNTHSYNLIN